MLFKNMQIALIILVATLCLAPVCPMGGGNVNPPPVDNPIDPGDPTQPPDPIDPGDEPDEWAYYSGDLNCRPVGKQPAWLRARLPIALNGCSRNFQIRIPHGAYNSVAAASPGVPQGAFGKGWNLDFEQSLEVRDGLVIVRAGDLTESHFVRDELDVDGELKTVWVPEPYLKARLIPPGPGDDAWVMVDLSDNSRSIFRRDFDPGSPYFLISEIHDRHGLVTYYQRDGWKIKRVTDSIVANAGEKNWWYQFVWSGNRITNIEDADGKNWFYIYDGNGKLTSIQLPGGRSQNLTYQSGSDLIASISLPGLPAHPMSYKFDPDGHLEEIRGLDGSLEYRIEWNDGGYEGQMLDVYGPKGALWQLGYRLDAWGCYLASVFAEGRSMMYERNFEMYLERTYDDQGRLTVYQPDDAPRPGTTTVIRRPPNQEDPSAHYEEFTWGPFATLVAWKRVPGGQGSLAYAGVHDCGFEPPEWAFLQPCRGEGQAGTLTYKYLTENRGADDERRITIRKHSMSRLSNWVSVRNRYGHLKSKRFASGIRQQIEYDYETPGGPHRGFLTGSQQEHIQASDGHLSGIQIARTHSKMGVRLTDQSGPLHPVGDRPAVAWTTTLGYAPDGAVISNKKSTNGQAMEERRFEDRTDTGLPRHEVIQMMFGSNPVTGHVWREFDEFGRELSSKSFVPDDSINGEETPYGLGQIIDGGRKTFND